MTVVISTTSRNGMTNYQHVRNQDTWCRRWKFVFALWHNLQKFCHFQKRKR